MASTAHKTEAEVVEHHDAPDVLDAKIDQLADIIRNSKYMISWTGAGISTSCGIPDFRGPNGVWTMRAQGKNAVSRGSTISVAPSVSHMALKALIDQGILKKLISSNCDGLHRRSGIAPKHVTELHGNSNRMRCNKCTKSAWIDGRSRQATNSHKHETDKRCPERDCDGVMCDTIINFGEYLEDGVQPEANKHGYKADCLLVLGTSLRVITCDALECIEHNQGALVIVNLQITPYDDQAALRIFATVDEVMVPLMARLGIEIPPYRLTRRAKVSYFAKSKEVAFEGCDEVGCPFFYATAATITDAAGAALSPLVVANPAVPWSALRVACPENAAAAAALQWMPTKHRDEPPCVVPLPAPLGDTTWVYLAQMTLLADGSAWEVETKPFPEATGASQRDVGARRRAFPW